jgi:glycosyltransferase involved in cell wall biosynthesis
MADQQVLVSIIVPTYNRLPLLKEAIHSVMAQDFDEWEILVVDDGSTDRTEEFVSALNDLRIRCIALSHKGNVARVRNAGIHAARGHYIAFLDSDDIWLSGKLRKQVAEMRQENARWSYTGYALIDEQRQQISSRAGAWKPLAGNILTQVLTTDADIAISTLMVERSLLQEIGGFTQDPSINLREDYDLVLRLAAVAAAGIVDQPLVLIRDHVGRTTRTCEDAFERTARVYELYLQNCKDPKLARVARRRRAYHLAEAAVHHAGKRAYLTAAKLYALSVVNGISLRLGLSAAKRGLVSSLLSRPRSEGGSGGHRTSDHGV